MVKLKYEFNFELLNLNTINIQICHKIYTVYTVQQLLQHYASF